MKSFVISQHQSIDYEGTDSRPVAVRQCSEEEVQQEVDRLNAGVTTNVDDMCTHYYDYVELPTIGFSNQFDLPSKDKEYQLISIRNFIFKDIERAHNQYYNSFSNPIVKKFKTFKEFFMASCISNYRDFCVIDVERIFDEVLVDKKLTTQ